MGAIDADAHVIETVQTWSYLDDEERRFTPQLMTQSFGAELRSNEGILHAFQVHRTAPTDLGHVNLIRVSGEEVFRFSAPSSVEAKKRSHLR